MSVKKHSKRAAVPVGFALGMLLVSSPASALDDSVMVLSGGLNSVGGFTSFIAPGTGNVAGATSPGTGGGAQAAQILLPAGQLRDLRVHVVVENDPPTSGKLKVSVFVNGVESKLKCSVSGTDICKTNKKRKVNIANDDGVGFRVQNNLVGAGATVVTMTVLYD